MSTERSFWSVEGMDDICNNKKEKTMKNALLDSVVQNETVDSEKKMTAKIDIEHLFSLMPNRRYVYVIRRLVLQEAEPKVVAQELRTNVDNLYNIKKRAIAALTEIALKEVLLRWRWLSLPTLTRLPRHSKEGTRRCTLQRMPSGWREMHRAR